MIECLFTTAGVIAVALTAWRYRDRIIALWRSLGG